MSLLFAGVDWGVWDTVPSLPGTHPRGTFHRSVSAGRWIHGRLKLAGLLIYRGVDRTRKKYRF
ncbi:hypothetical protein [Singulisphaera sp. GP187]|uniref:hypothetical protein n=1 Tax=Singulisphaera sp. GP187 TaxID=1882752 RepID=UPI0011615184|nr:hypothetical protein [Singulisphaera sp. GP187]